MRPLPPWNRAIATLAFAVVLTGCSEEEVRVYRVKVLPGEDPIALGDPAASTSLTWTAPAGSEELEAGQFQTAVYQLDQEALLTVSSLPGRAGGLEANLNRWRGQLGLPPVSGRDAEGDPMKFGSSEFRLFDLSAAPDEDRKDEILAAVLTRPAETWFFKLTSSDGSISSRRPLFETFLAGVKESTPAPATAAADPVAPQAAEESEAAEAPPVPSVEVKVPAGWERSEGSAMRAASFRVPSPKGMDGDVSIVPLPGNAGSVLDNINRWRGQLGLPPLSSNDDPELGSTIDSKYGAIVLSHMVSERPLIEGNQQAAISGAILKHGGFTWFFKMTGDAGVVSENRNAFETFVRSAILPDPD